MFDLESVARRMTDHLLKDVQMEPIQKAKVEYGLALVLGVASELILTVGVSFFLGTAIYTLIMMLSALALRIFSGGAHCSSFRRCYVFTLVVFVASSLLVKAMVMNIAFKALMGISLLLVLVSLFLIWRPKRFTLWVWLLCAALSIWGVLSSSAASWHMILTLSSVAGLTIQAFMGKEIGQKFVQLSDKLMRNLGI